MNRAIRRISCALLLAAILACAPSARAELLEEIVAWVNGDIITKSELEEQEQVMIAEAYKNLTGEELDEAVQTIRSGVLMQMIDTKILVDRASQLYNLQAMADAYYDSFMKQQGFQTEAEFLQAIEAEGFDKETLKDRLIEMFAPEQVVRFEVGERISIGDAEIEKFYLDNPDRFRSEASVTIREIVLMAETPELRAERRPEIEAAVARVEGEGFDAVAKELSEAGTRAEGGKIEGLERGDLSEKLERVAFELPVGETSDPIEMPYGWHVIHVEERSDESIRPLDEIRERVREALERQRYQADLAAFLKKARDEAEWCVKDSYRDRIALEPPECKFR